MTSEARRDPISDPLLTPENAALVLIDYQPPQLNTIRSMDPQTLLTNTVTLAKVAQLYKLPKILSTVGVKTGVNPDSAPEIKAAILCELQRDWSREKTAVAVAASSGNSWATEIAIKQFAGKVGK